LRNEAGEVKRAENEEAVLGKAADVMGYSLSENSTIPGASSIKLLS